MIGVTLLPKSINADNRVLRRRLLAILFILAIAFAVRGLTMRFVRDHLNDPSWFQSGSYALFHQQAVNILNGTSSMFWINDPSQTETAIYPPGYPLWIALIYTLSGEHSPVVVQRVQWVLDALSVLLIIGIGVTAYNWPTGLAAGGLAALSPVLALSGATPTADAPSSWLVIAGTWMLVLAWKRTQLNWAILAGVAVGASCWFRVNALLLMFFWAVALLLALRSERRRAFLLAGIVVLSACIILTPLIIRNAFAFRAFVPAGLGMGTNLWEGLGETDRAGEFGAVYGDQALIEQERRELGISPDARFTLYYPDGVRRDRERARKAFAVILRNPVWYTGVMLRRMWGILKVAGEPLPFYGSSGINVTAMKTLPANWHGGFTAFIVNILANIQSVVRYLLLPLVAIGLFLAVRRNAAVTILLLATVFYYLVPGTAAHTEIRYALPLHCMLAVFAGLAISTGVSILKERRFGVRIKS